jgi:hypothetical protein
MALPTSRGIATKPDRRPDRMLGQGRFGFVFRRLVGDILPRLGRGPQVRIEKLGGETKA